MTTAGPPLALLNSLDGYRLFYTDAALWRPFVERICWQRGWSCNLVYPGVAGTFPTFIVDEQRVVKFFGPLFDGQTCWRVEQEAARLMADVSAVPVAGLLDSGMLRGETGWYYLVFDFVPGVSIGKVYTEVLFEDKLSLARWLGGWLPQMHRLGIHGASFLPRLNQETVRGWWTARWGNDRQWWPIHLAAQVEEYLSVNAAFLQAVPDHFIHADLTQDHLLGRLADGHWTTLAVIDFGDAMLGNIFYELVAMHLDLFDCDKRLLATFLQAYGLSPDPDFDRKAMVTSLLHQFDVYGHLFSWRPELKETRTLEELAERLWKMDSQPF